MSISSTQPAVADPVKITAPAHEQVNMIMGQLAHNPDALMLVRLQHLLNLIKKDAQVKQCFGTHIDQVMQYAESLGHQVI
jgi:hypothetical protein